MVVKCPEGEERNEISTFLRRRLAEGPHREEVLASGLSVLKFFSSAASFHMLAFLCSFYSNCWFESTRSTMRWRSVGVGRSDTSIYRQTTSYLLWRAVNRGYPADSQQDPGGSHRKLSFPRVCLCNYLIEKPQISKQAATMVTVGNPHPHLYTALVAPPQPPFCEGFPISTWSSEPKQRLLRASPLGSFLREVKVGGGTLPWKEFRNTEPPQRDASTATFSDARGDSARATRLVSWAVPVISHR